MRYLQRTKYYMLTYRRSNQLEIISYYDSNFFGCQDRRKSTSGYIYLLVGGAISWKSAKQTFIASSTMAAEFIACYEVSNHGIWLQNLSLDCRLWMILKDHSRYFVIIRQQCCIPITIGARQSRSILTSSS